VLRSSQWEHGLAMHPWFITEWHAFVKIRGLGVRSPWPLLNFEVHFLFVCKGRWTLI